MTDPANSDDRIARLVCRATQGDAVALKVLLTEVQARLIALVSARVPKDLRRVVAAEDLVQEADMEVFQRIGDFELRGPDSFYRWVATIALSRCRDAAKAHRTAKRGGGGRVLSRVGRRTEDSGIALLDTLAGPTQTPSRNVARGEAIDAVEDALDQLPDHYRQAVWLVHIAGRPVREAALAMGRTDRAIHGLCRQGLKVMREYLGSESRFLSRVGEFGGRR